jgi:hypothetical protein
LTLLLIRGGALLLVFGLVLGVVDGGALLAVSRVALRRVDRLVHVPAPRSLLDSRVQKFLTP